MTSSDIEAGRINLGLIRPVENIGSLRVHERYLLAVAGETQLSAKSEIDIGYVRSAKIISFSRYNLSYSQRYFTEKFERHDLTGNVAYTCDDIFSLMSLILAGLSIGFVPEWTRDPPNRGFEMKKVRGTGRLLASGVDFAACARAYRPTAARAILSLRKLTGPEIPGNNLRRIKSLQDLDLFGF